jgi:hypothetical protein
MVNGEQMAAFIHSPFNANQGLKSGRTKRYYLCALRAFSAYFAVRESSLNRKGREVSAKGAKRISTLDLHHLLFTIRRFI